MPAGGWPPPTGRARGPHGGSTGGTAGPGQTGRRRGRGLRGGGRRRAGGLDGRGAGAAGVMQGELEDQLGRRRDFQVAARKRRHQVQMFFDGLEDGVGVEVNVPHHLSEQVPFDLRKAEKQMFVAQQRVFTATSLFDRPVDNPLRGVGQLAR